MSRAVADTDRPIRLDLNTAPILNESAIRAALRASPPSRFAMYPDPGAPDLTAALAARLGVGPEGILVGNGSDELLDFAVRAFAPRGRSMGVLLPSFGMYDHAARANGVEVLRVPLRENLPVDDLAACGADAFFLPSPNNPTGTAFPPEAFEALIDKVHAPLVIDEAYAEFARQDLRSLARSRDRVVVLRTFSKAYGLPGIRIGYAVGDPELIERMRAIKMPYNVTSFGEQAALAALRDESFVTQAVDLVERERPRLYEGLRTAGWPVWPSRANFVFVGPLRRAADVHGHLAARSIRVRLVDWPGGADGASLRITVGRAEHHRALLEALQEVASWRA